MDEFLVASSGTLVAAALESAGYYYQSLVLDTLTNPFANAAGGLIYLVGVLAILMVFIFTGEVKQSFWLLVAPGLFLSCIAIRTETSGSAWIFGEEERDNEQVHEELSTVLDKASGGELNADENARISKLFGVFNKTVSSVVKEFTRVINGTRMKADILFIARDQLFAAINFPMVPDRGFVDLLHAGLRSNCQLLMGNAQLFMDQTANQCSRCQAGRTYMYTIDQPYVLTHAAYDYITMLAMEYPDLYEEAITAGAPQGTSGSISFGSTFSDSRCIADQVVEACGGLDSEECGNPGTFQLSYFFGNAEHGCPNLYSAVPPITSQLCNNYSSRGGSLANLDDYTTQGLETLSFATEARDEFIEERLEIGNKPLTCPQIWNLNYLGLHKHAFDAYNAAITIWQRLRGRTDVLGLCSGFVPGSDDDEVFGMLADWVGVDNDDSTIESALTINQIARRLFRRELQKGSVSATQANTVYDHSNIDTIGVSKDSEGSMIERSRSSDPAWVERTQMLEGALTMPYYQGLGLFFLAVTFPFFALLLLIPGKHAGFFLWFGLWAWLKSWDVGYSIVMLLSDILYALYVVNWETIVNVFIDGLHPDLAVAAYSLYIPDPTYDLKTYYHIVAISLFSIPTVTGYTILGAFRGGQGLVSAGGSMIQVNPKSIWLDIRNKTELVKYYEQDSSSTQSNTSESSGQSLTNGASYLNNSSSVPWNTQQGQSQNSTPHSSQTNMNPMENLLPGPNTSIPVSMPRSADERDQLPLNDRPTASLLESESRNGQQMYSESLQPQREPASYRNEQQVNPADRREPVPSAPWQEHWKNR